MWTEAGPVVQIYNPRAEEAEAKGSGIWGQLGLQRKTQERGKKGRGYVEEGEGVPIGWDGGGSYSQTLSLDNSLLYSQG